MDRQDGFLQQGQTQLARQVLQKGGVTDQSVEHFTVNRLPFLAQLVYDLGIDIRSLFFWLYALHCILYSSYRDLGSR